MKPERSPMSSVGEHLRTVLDLGAPLAPRDLPVGQCLGRVLARDLTALLDVPPFANSAMDGFAVRWHDVVDLPQTAETAGPPGEIRLRVVGDAPAGQPSERPVGPGEAIRVMTGGLVPAGADTVVPVELTDHPAGQPALPAWVTVRGPLGRRRGRGAHIRARGEDVAAGARVLAAGTMLTPAALAAAVSVGYGELRVHPRPRVFVLTTGSELLPPGELPAAGQIPDSNSTLLAGLVVQAGSAVVGQVAVGDDPVAVADALLAAAEVSDLVITSGGVSVGAFDVLRQLSVPGELSFEQVAMQPGKPQGSGVVQVTGRLVPVLAFPGNPVSVFVSFHVFAVPLLRRLAGLSGPSPRPVAARAGVGWSKPAGRRQYMPVRLVPDAAGWTCAPAHRLGSGSHLIASLHLADGLAEVGEHISEVRAGDVLPVIKT